MRGLPWLALIGASFLIALAAQWRRMVGRHGGGTHLVDLPLREHAADPARARRTLVVFLTSDVGWIGFNTSLPQALAANGYPTVAWNSLGYYLNERRPEAAAQDLVRVIDTYSRLWGTDRFALVGYSWGAGVLPFLANALPAHHKARLSAAVYLAYPGVGAFHFRPSAWLLRIGDDALPARDQVAAMPRVPSVCMAGDGDPIRDCRSIEPLGVERHLLAAGHSLSASLAELLPTILETLAEGDTAATPA